MSTSTQTLKTTSRKNLLGIYHFASTVSTIGVVAFRDATTRRFLIEGLSAIGMGVIVLGDGESRFANVAFRDTLSKNELHGLDFFIYDGECEGIDVVEYMKLGIVPIMPEENVFSGILKTFNPMKFEGNGFFYKKPNPFCVFERVIAYIENIKFPEDRRVLVKNVTGTF